MGEKATKEMQILGSLFSQIGHGEFDLQNGIPAGISTPSSETEWLAWVTQTSTILQLQKKTVLQVPR